MPACPARLRLLSGSCSSARSFAPRFLHAGLTERRSAARFARCDQLAGGLPPPSRCPCWAHTKKAANCGGLFLLGQIVGSITVEDECHVVHLLRREISSIWMIDVHLKDVHAVTFDGMYARFSRRNR